MAARDQPGDGWTVVLRRQPARMVEGRPEGGYTDAGEIICCDCGDHPDLGLLRGLTQASAGLPKLVRKTQVTTQNRISEPHRAEDLMPSPADRAERTAPAAS